MKRNGSGYAIKRKILLNTSEDIILKIQYVCVTIVSTFLLFKF